MTFHEKRLIDSLLCAGLGSFLRENEWTESTNDGAGALTGRMALTIIPYLRADARFIEGCLYGLHTDVGDNLTEFRSVKNSLVDHDGKGLGSTQIVIDMTTGRFYADVDRFNPYQDVANAFGHLFGEVLWPRIREAL